jgi:Kinesin motor domain
MTGSAARTSSATKMNQVSSRSHSVMIINVTQQERDRGLNTWLTVVSAKILLVDLAGSELVGKSYLAGKQLEEAKMINKSLSSLGLVIAALTTRFASTSHIPYRNSKLTRILEDSLGGTSKLCLIMTVSPAVGNSNETLSTLRFGLRAKTMQNKVIHNIQRISSSNYGHFNSPSKVGGSLIRRMSSASSRDSFQSEINNSMTKVENKVTEMNLRRAEKRLEAQSAQILALNAQLESFENKKTFESISRQGAFIDLKNEDEVDLRKSGVIQSAVTSVRMPLTVDCSMEKVIQIGASPIGAGTGASLFENSVDSSEFVNFTCQLACDTMDGLDSTEDAFADPYLETNLIYKCLDFDENGVAINTLKESPPFFAPQKRTGIKLKTDRRSLKADGTLSSFPGFDFSCAFPRRSTELSPTLPRESRTPTAYGSTESYESDDLLTKLAHQLANESIIVLAVTELLNTERENVSELTKKLAELRTTLEHRESQSLAMSSLRPEPENPFSLPPLSWCGSIAAVTSMYAEVEEGRQLSAFLSKQLKSQTVQLRVLSEQLLKQKVFASTVTEKLSRVQASTAGMAVTHCIEMASIELLVTSLREKIQTLDRETCEKNQKHTEIEPGEEVSMSAVAVPMPSTDACALVAVITSAIAITTSNTGLENAKKDSKKVSQPKDYIPRAHTPEVKDPSSSPFRADVPILNLVATVVAAIEEKCTSRPASIKIEDRSFAATCPRPPGGMSEGRAFFNTSPTCESKVFEKTLVASHQAATVTTIASAGTMTTHGHAAAIAIPVSSTSVAVPPAPVTVTASATTSPSKAKTEKKPDMEKKRVLSAPSTPVRVRASSVLMKSPVVSATAFAKSSGQALTNIRPVAGAASPSPSASPVAKGTKDEAKVVLTQRSVLPIDRKPLGVPTAAGMSPKAIKKPMQPTGESSIISKGDIALPNLADIFAATFMIENNAVITSVACTAQPPSLPASRLHVQPLPAAMPVSSVTVPLPPSVTSAPVSTVTAPLPPSVISAPVSSVTVPLPPSVISAPVSTVTVPLPPTVISASITTVTVPLPPSVTSAPVSTVTVPLPPSVISASISTVTVPLPPTVISASITTVTVPLPPSVISASISTVTVPLPPTAISSVTVLLPPTVISASTSSVTLPLPPSVTSAPVSSVTVP